jgi:long-chain acyl-CoA synthetase
MGLFYFMCQQLKEFFVEDKAWVESYPEGVPLDVRLDRYGSIREVFEEACRKFADKTAVSNFGSILTYEQLEEASRDFGAYLQSLHGIKKGDRVALMMPNILSYPVALFGAIRAGFVVVNINPFYTPTELEYQLRDSGAKAIVVFEGVAHTLEKIIQNTPVEHVVVACLGDMHGFLKRTALNLAFRKIKKGVPSYSLARSLSFRQALNAGRDQDLKKCALGQDDLIFVQYTGGTTGGAKGAMLTHGNLVANLQQASAWLSCFLEEGKEVVVTALPMYHIFCLTINILLFIKMGGHCLLITDPRDTRRFVKTLASEPFSVITGVNSLFNALLNVGGLERVNFSKVKLVLGGGASVNPSVAERWKKQTGTKILEAYGLTETSPAVCVNPWDVEFNGSIGLPVPSTLVSIRDNDFNELPVGQIGELCVKGPQVMRGYWNRPRETDEVLTADGWLRTGDVGYMDAQGFFFITDRKKDMVLVSGFNVYPKEIESVVTMIETVAEAAAIGVPDDKTGEAVKLFVVRKTDGLSDEAVLEHCRQHLTAYKIPKYIEFVSELPKSAVGKILKRELRQRSLVNS